MKVRSLSDSIVLRPDSHTAIRSEAKKLLKRARAVGIHPTPIDALLRASKVEEFDQVEEAKKSFIKGAPAAMADALDRAWGKLRGFADLKKRAIYVTPDDSRPRVAWTKLHELGHQMLPWQAAIPRFEDDDVSLSDECEETFDHEANCFAAELLFQGDYFLDLANEYRPEFNSVFALSKQFGASNHATARRFADQCDEPVALVSYYPSRFVREDGTRSMRLGRGHSASQAFLKKHPSLKLPSELPSDHPWLSAIREGAPAGGRDGFDCGDGTESTLIWEAWWNHYNLLVLLRKPPALDLLGRMFT